MIVATSTTSGVLLGLAAVSGMLLAVAVVVVAMEVRRNASMGGEIARAQRLVTKTVEGSLADRTFCETASLVQDYLRSSWLGTADDIAERAKPAAEFIRLINNDRADVDEAYEAVMKLTVEELAYVGASDESDWLTLIAFRDSVEQLESRIADATAKR